MPQQISRQNSTTGVQQTSSIPTVNRSTIESQERASAQQTQQARQITKNLGEVNSLPDAGGIIGNLIDVLIPQEGEKISMEFNLNIPIHPNVSISFRLKGEASRETSNQVKLRTEVQLGVTGKLEVHLGIGKLQGFLRGAGLGYIETVGSDSEEAFGFISLLARQKIAECDQRIANIVMNQSARDDMFRNMGEGEYIEGGLGLEFGVGVGVQGRQEGSSVSGEVRYLQGSRYTSNEGSTDYQKQDTRSGSLSLQGSYNARPSLGLRGTLQYSTVGANETFEAGLEANADFSVAELDAVLVSTTWLSGLVGTFVNLISNGERMFQGRGPQKLGTFIGMIRNINPTTLVQYHYAAGALQRLSNYPGLQIGHKVSIKARMSNGKLGGEVSLERYSQIQYGGSAHDPIHVLLQNIDPVLKMEF